MLDKPQRLEKPETPMQRRDQTLPYTSPSDDCDPGSDQGSTGEET